MTNYLEVTNLSKSFDSFQLHNISFTLPKGYIMGLIGPNGSGKTTTIKLILNMLKRTGGTVKVMGLDNIAEEQKVKSELGVVFDTNYFSDDWKVSQVEKSISVFYPNWDSQKFVDMLRKFHIAPTKKVKELSKGMQMKLMLACAFSYAGVSFADEFNNRTIIHIIAHGYSRMQFLMAKLIHYLLGCLLIILAYLTISTGIAAAVLGTSTPASVFIGHILYNILRGLPFYFVMTMVFFFFVIVTRKGALAIAGSVSSAILFVVFTNKAYSAQAFPEQSWLRLLPNIQLSMLYDGSLIFTDYLIAIALSVISSIIIFTVCIAIIRKTEL